ncbi:MAG: MBL fold metallo-hydrolase [Rhodobacteraceae bacterium]|nr:MBL fold metallo-hydrolase [Paracoccaceae bacterium]
MKHDQGATLRYLGWSGFLLRRPGARPIVFDPPEETAIPKDEDVCLLVTHGHPEHIAGTAAYLKLRNRTARADVIASPPICRLLKRCSRNELDSFHACNPWQGYCVDGTRFDSFLCHHMPLLPPETGEGLRRLGQVVRNPRLLMNIAGGVIRFPLVGPLLGFNVSGAGMPSVVFYGEGLHRCTGRAEVKAVGARVQGDVLITAVEPEDVEVLPELLKTAGVPIIIPYEAHAAWREGFRMPCADLEAFSTELQIDGFTVLSADPNVAVVLA